MASSSRRTAVVTGSTKGIGRAIALRLAEETRNVPVIIDFRVTREENVFPMIPSGKAHNEMLLPEQATDEATVITNVMTGRPARGVPFT